MSPYSKFWLALLILSSIAWGQTTPNLGLTILPHSAPNWDTATNTNWNLVDAGTIIKSPVADQTITGAHALILSDPASTLNAAGNFHSGIPFSALSAFAQGDIFAESFFTANVFSEGGASKAGTLQAVSDWNRFGQSAFYGSGIVDLSADQHGFTGTLGATYGAFANLNGHITDTGSGGSYVIGSQAETTVTGPGTVGNVVGFLGGGNLASGSPTIPINASFMSLPNTAAIGGGTLNAQFYGYDQGSGSTDYGIYLAGSTHNNLGGGLTQAGSLNGVVNGLADTNAGHDFCQKIATAFASLTSGRSYHVIAQSPNASEACSVNPFASLPTGTSGILEISSPLIVSTAEIKLPTQWRMVGMSRGTIIQSDPGLTANSLITLGDRGSDTGIASNRFGVRIENLTVDCNSNLNLTYCVYSETMQEQSGPEHVLIKGCKICVKVDDTANATPQNWHMEDLEIYPQNTPNAIGVDVDGASSGMHSITGVTVFAKAADSIGMRFNNMRGGFFSGIHCEFMVDCVRIGDLGNVYGSQFSGISGQTNVTNLVHISSGHTIKGVSFTGLGRLGSTALILDDYRTYTTAVDGMAFYSTGDVATTTGPMFNDGLSTQGDMHVGIPSNTGSASSKLLFLDGLYNNGSTDFNVDSWTLKNLVNAGTNPVATLTFNHTGSSGAPTINMPYNVTFGGSSQVTAAGSIFGGAFISTTANPAASGQVRLASADIINFRNNGNSAQINGLSKNSSDVVSVGGTAGISTANHTIADTGVFGSNISFTSTACETSFAPTTLATGATTTDTGQNCLPGNSTIDAVVARVTTTITAACTGWSLGDPTTAARFSSNNTVLTSGTTTDAAHIGTFNNTGIASATTGTWQAAAAKVRITCAGGNPGAGAIRVIVYSHTWTAPTS